MEKYVYIKRSIAKTYVDFAEPLSPEEYNNLGETWNDYMNNMWVLLSDEQVAFHAAHPTASVKEVWDMEFTPEPPAPVRTLEQAKSEMIRKIDEYDRSEAVNSFTLGNQRIWLTVEERQQIATQISASEAAGRESMTRWFMGQPFTFTLVMWRQMLVAIEIYAGDALNVTEAHKAAVMTLETIETVDAFDYESGYPEKINFDSLLNQN